MASALDTRIRQFFRWWGAELGACLPPALAEVLFPAPSRIELALTPGRVVLSRSAGRRHEVLAKHTTDPDRAEELVAELRAALGRARAEEVVLRLPRDRVLEPALEVPVIAAGALEEVIAQEMDRKTPFSAGEVHYDWRVTGRDPDGERLSVRLRVARRADIAEAVRLARAIGLSPTRVDGEARGHGTRADGTGRDETFNLLPRAERARSSRLLSHLVAGMALVTLALGAAALYLAFDRAERELALIQEEVARQRAAAEEVRVIQDRAEALRASATGLIEARRAQAPAAEVIDEVSRRVPDGHWLFEMRYRQGELYLFGFSPAPTQLLRNLEASPLLSEAGFAAPVVAGQEEGTERFAIRAEVEPRGGPDTAGRSDDGEARQ